MKIVGVRQDNSQKTEYYNAQKLDLKEGDTVMVPTENDGVRFARVESAPEEADVKTLHREPAAVIRIATEQDYENLKQKKIAEESAMKVAVQKIEKHGLPMKLVGADALIDGTKLVFYFTADTRVDFRDLVKDLASCFRTRIELRQIGIRDECKMLGGVAPCGRVCCCANHLKDFTHVSVKMVKMQGLSLNPTKISGLCGRLMCCLQYENAHYTETARSMPRIGSDVTTPDGKGIAVSVNMLKETVQVKLEVKDGYEYRDYALGDLKLTKRMAGGQARDERDDDRDEELPSEE